MNGLVTHTLDHLKGAAEAAPRGGWFVTFADLLTLMLCFFISTISLGAPGARARGETVEQHLDVAPQQTAAGTSLAISPTEALVSEFRLQESELSATDDPLAPLTVSKIQAAANSKVFSGGAIRTTVCGGTAEGKTEVLWFSGLSRITAIRRQLVDAGVDPARMEFQIVGPNCSELQRGGENGVGAVIRFARA